MSAEQKWLQIFLDIVTYEFEHVSDGQLLSEGADRLVDKRPVLGRLLILGAGTALTLHLANVLSPPWDVVSQEFWRRMARRPPRRLGK